MPINPKKPEAWEVEKLLKDYRFHFSPEAVEEFDLFFEALNVPERTNQLTPHRRGRPPQVADPLPALLHLAIAFVRVVGKDFRPSYDQYKEYHTMRFVRKAYALAGYEVSASTIRNWVKKHDIQNMIRDFFGPSTAPVDLTEYEEFWKTLQESKAS